jgi:hypothetical protein
MTSQILIAFIKFPMTGKWCCKWYYKYKCKYEIGRQMITWSNFTWSKLSFFTWSKVLINILSLDRIFWDFSVDRKF